MFLKFILYTIEGLTCRRLYYIIQTIKEIKTKENKKMKKDKYVAQKKYMAKLKKFCFRLPPEEWEAFRESCERAGSTPTTEIRKFIKNAENDNPV